MALRGEPGASASPAPQAVGAHKTSMLQDVENGRALELEALVGSVVELGAITGTPTPVISALYAATSLLSRTLQQAGGRLQVQTPKQG